MRLHSLTMTAFGPFADTVRVDFDALGAGGLFLFTGPTGAGKTSVLDAVCFALYGQVPGTRDAGRALRSDHAADGVAPEVVLEATVRDRRLRVTRSPAWDRPKRRGSGTTPEQARVLVQERVGDRWDTLAARLDEAGHLLGALLGLTAGQFCQVVLLPQGQFADFLRADAEKRRELLESLFDTRRFADVEAWLVARRQQSHRELGELDDGYRQLLARVSEAAGEHPPAELLDRLADEEVLEWVDGLLDRALAAAETADAEAKAAAALAARAAQALAAAERDAELRQRAAVLTGRGAALTAAQSARDTAHAELVAARRVAPLVPVLAEAGRLRTELESARAAAAAVHGHVVGVLAATGTAGPVPASPAAALPAVTMVRDASRATAAEAARLGVLADQEAEAARLARRADELQRTAVELGSRADEAARWLATAPARRATLEAARDAARLADAALPQARRDRDELARRVEAAARRDTLYARLVEVRDALRPLVDRHQKARDDLQAVRARRLAGLAAELAVGLVDGETCPVCGSAEHPSPATADAVETQESEQDAEAAVTVAEAARRAGETRVTALEVELAAAGAVAGETPVDALRGELQVADHDLAQLTAEAAGLDAAVAAATGFAQEHEQWARDRVAHETEQRSAVARAVELHAQAARLTDDLTTARGDDPSVAARHRRLERATADLEGLVGHLTDVDRLEQAADAALARAQAAVTAAGLGDVAEVAAAVRDDNRQGELEDLVRAHDSELSAVTEQLADPEIAAAQHAPPPDLTGRREAAEAAADARDRAVAAAHAATARTRALVERAADVSATAQQRRPVAERHRLVDRLSRLAEGKSTDNRLRMSLAGYVLAARLEQVAAAAGERLARMTSGRYQLVHSDRAGTGRARGGLHLRVLDAWTGVERDPGTLSGGETFAASLALALGLADVVTAEAGGTQLETLFVDEGFGSLDDDTLDDVMGVLDGLREGGRTVGIVSHVADLRQRVPVQLRIQKGRAGSHVHQ